jgi:hypothetical protein
MNKVFSVDEIADSFWSGTINSANPTHVNSAPMPRSDSEWSLMKFVEQYSAADPEIPLPETPIIATDSTLTGVVSPMESSSSKRDEFAVAEEEVLPLPLNPYPMALADSDEYRAILKSKLELACAAVALRVSLYLYLYLYTYVDIDVIICFDFVCY